MNKKSDKRNRLQMRFWLDVTKSEEDHLEKQVTSLKKGRQFTDYVRNGLRLMLSLAERDVGVLVELFPWIPERFNGQFVQSASSTRDLEQRIEYLQQLILTLSAQQVAASKVSGPQPLSVPSVPAPHFDDDDGHSQIILKARVDDGQSAANFLKSLQVLQ